MEHEPHPAVLVSVDDLGWDGFGVACLRPHLLPESVVLGDIHQLVLDVLPIKDSGYFALLGFDLEPGRERQVTGRWRGARRVGTHPACQPGSAQCPRYGPRLRGGTPSTEGWVRAKMGTVQREQGRGHRGWGGGGFAAARKRDAHPREEGPRGTQPCPPPLTSREPVTEVL